MPKTKEKKPIRFIENYPKFSPFRRKNDLEKYFTSIKIYEAFKIPKDFDYKKKLQKRLTEKYL